MKPILTYILISLLLAITLYLLFWPVKINPAAWNPPKVPPATGVYAKNNMLAEIEILAEGHHGPEAVAFDQDGYLYAGLEDGRIIRVSPDGKMVETFAQGGIPLGMKFDVDGNLVVADGTLGLISVDENGKITPLTVEVDGSPIIFANDLAIASDGTVYFSDSSKKFTNPETAADMFEHRPNGRLLVYHPETGETSTLLDQLYFPNGVALSPEEDYLLFSETSMYRIKRLWLGGEKTGEVEVFIDNLPGFPDNLTYNGSSTYWLALASSPKNRGSLDMLMPWPFLRKMLWRLPFLVNTPTKGVGYILGLNLEGNVIHNLQDPSGDYYSNTTSVIEQEGYLYIGSFSASGIGRVPAP
jgi:sugar lactone lactonase YvrE